MRIRATVVAVTGALALSAFAVPAAQAAPSAAPAVTFSNMKVNKGKNIVVGATGKVAVPVTYTLTKPADLSTSSFENGPLVYRGTTLGPSTNPMIISDAPGKCTAASTTVLNCSATIYVSADYGDVANNEAGVWKVGALAIGKDAQSEADAKWQGGLGTTKILRLAKLTANAAPEPVKKGRTITVTGKLTRANWDTNTYGGYSGVYAQLQFRKKGTTTYKTVKSVKTTATGGLKTTVTASADGYYRYTFAGTATTAPVSAAGDFIDVQ
ncbi:hypothetical protein ABZ614_08700 [Streptomyces sp. NPDC013178]|uniref:hypothetical protein n=1 Tax=unclassified Streptomyces TaxID=2593676 RepID=UPI0033E23C89